MHTWLTNQWRCAIQRGAKRKVEAEDEQLSAARKRRKLTSGEDEALPDFPSANSYSLAVTGTVPMMLAECMPE